MRTSSINSASMEAESAPGAYARTCPAAQRGPTPAGDGWERRTRRSPEHRSGMLCRLKSSQQLQQRFIDPCPPQTSAGGNLIGAQRSGFPFNKPIGASLHAHYTSTLVETLTKMERKANARGFPRKPGEPLFAPMQLRLEGLGYDDIAHVLGIRSGTIGALLARGLKKIRESALCTSKR